MRKTYKTAVVTAVITILVVVPTSVWAGHAFTDVSSSNIFHGDITWLADAGVTKGCNPPANDEFCPEDFVTRQQMAAFLRRLAENQVVDADTVDGLDAVDPGLFGTATHESFNSTSSTEWEDIPGMATQVTIPAGHTGRVVARFNSASSCAAGGGSTRCFVRATVDGSEIGPSVFAFFDDDDGGDGLEAHSIQRLSGELGAGTHTVKVQFRVGHVDQVLVLLESSLVAEVELTS